MSEDPQKNSENSLPAANLEDGSRFDEYFAALADYRRRCALHHLAKKERASLSAVTQQIAAWELDCPPNDVPDGTIERIKIELYHKHLPRLSEANIVEYDRLSAMLVYRDPPTLIEACLELCAWQDYPN